ncbi:MAG: SDR family oxidoreductase [Candidatus Omnitrophica bacterium]|nr:SDR family oxidoreductase [Candidatus Omnitrophota bacterium]
MPETFPPQHQERSPGLEKDMIPKPLCKGEWYMGSGKLKGKVAIITGGDSGIGRSVAIFFAREGADIAIVYYDEHEDARKTAQMVEEEGGKVILLPGDVGKSSFCEEVVRKTLDKFRKIDILVNNAAHQPFQDNIESLTDEQLERTFKTNIFSYFFLTRSAVKHLKPGSCVINTSSVVAYRGTTHLLDYSATKGAEVAFTRSLALLFAEKEIRVNAVAPGPIWTPLTPSTYPPEYMPDFGEQTVMKRAGQPEEVAPSYVFLASRDSSYMTGQVLHPNGGEIING